MTILHHTVDAQCPPERVWAVLANLVAVEHYNPTVAVPLRWMGFAGGPKVVPAFRFLFTADKEMLRAHFGRLAETPGLARIVPFHGTIIERDAATALRRAATTI